MAAIDLKAFARVGARQRLEQLRSEIEVLLLTFPELGKAGRAQATSVSEPGRARKRKRRKVSAAARTSISNAQKKR